MGDDDTICLRAITTRRDQIIIRQFFPVLARCLFYPQPAVCYQIAHAALAVVTHGYEAPLPYPLVNSLFGLESVVLQILSYLRRYDNGKATLTASPYVFGQEFQVVVGARDAFDIKESGCGAVTCPLQRAIDTGQMFLSYPPRARREGH